eukprot:gene15478-11070_t
MSAQAAEQRAAEQRAGEVGGGFAKWFKKYAIILIPGTFMTILTVDVVSNVNHRNFVENISPQYIELVREHYGFADEDLDEKRRVEFLESYYGNDFRIRIRLNDGSTKEVVVSGKTPVSTLVKEALSSSSASPNRSEVNIFASDMVEAEDSPVTASYSPSSSSDTGLVNSQWTPHLSQRYRQALQFKYRFYENLVFQPYSCIQSYMAMGNPGLFPFSYGVPQDRMQNKATPQTASKQQSGAVKDQERIFAQQHIDALEREIRQLETQKQMGFRDMDSVNEEIASKRQEISRIRRKHLGGFSLFW